MYDSTSHITPGYRFQYQVPPTPPAWSTIRIRSSPAWRSARRRADRRCPPPTITTSTSSVTGSPIGDGVNGIGEVPGEPLVVRPVDDVGPARHQALVALGQVRAHTTCGSYCG
jgi:hypothetical protein